jgi:hypothetical protein
MPARPTPRLVLVLAAGVLLAPVGAMGQAVTPQVPGLQPLSNAQQPRPDPKIVKTEVERKGKVGREIFISTYLTLSRDCRVGANPKLDVPEPPKNGKLYTRPNAINLRAVPGAPRTNCIGTSPYGLGLFYRPERRFKGEETFLFKIVYPDGDIREVSAKVIVE